MQRHKSNIQYVQTQKTQQAAYKWWKAPFLTYIIDNKAAIMRSEPGVLEVPTAFQIEIRTEKCVSDDEEGHELRKI